jgi:hypothetical protein
MTSGVGLCYGFPELLLLAKFLPVDARSVHEAEILQPGFAEACEIRQQ